MIYNKKKFNTFFKFKNIKLEEGKVFKRNYNKQYNKRKNIAKDHFLLTNAFNLTKLIITNNNNDNNKQIIKENYYFEENKTRYKVNIYNYQKTFGNIGNNHINTNEDELLKTLLVKIDTKNIEELLKEKERMINLQKKTLKGLSYKMEPLTYDTTKWKTFNKTNSLKTINNLNNRSIYKSKESINFTSPSTIFKNNNSLSIDSIPHQDKYIRNNPFQKRFHSHTINPTLKGIFNVIDTEEKIAEKNLNFLNYKKSLENNKKYYRTFRSEKINLKSNSINAQHNKRKPNLIRNVSKIKHKKDIEKVLFRQSKNLFNDIRNKLHSLYKKGKKMPSYYLEE